MRNKMYTGIRYLAALITACVARYFFSTVDCALLFFVTLFVMQVSPGRVFFRSMSRFLVILTLTAIVLFFSQENILFRHSLSVMGVGFLAGLLINFLVFPIRADELFQEFISSTLIAYRDYFLNVMSGRVVQETQLENTWLKWPFWLGRRYIDTKLRPGHYFFLQKLGQMCDVLFSLRALSVDIENHVDYVSLHESFLLCTQQFDQCFAWLIDKVAGKKVSETFPDIKNALTSLEKHYRDRMHLPLEALETQRDAVMVAHFICGLEDLYWLLMKLSESFIGM